MKAKDTVLDKDTYLSMWNKNNGRLDIILDKQAEISFKAGMIEAIKWLIQHKDTEEYTARLLGYEVTSDELCDKLKEWDIDWNSFYYSNYLLHPNKYIK